MAPGRGFAWPDERQELLLRVALHDRDEALAAWRSWQVAADLESVDAGSFRLLPFVFRRLEAWGCTEAAMPRLRGIYRQSWTRNAFLYRLLGPTLQGLRKAGIPVLLLKGVALAHGVYRDHGARPMKDADVLVPPQHLAAAEEIAFATGWKWKQQEERPLWLDVRHLTAPTRHDLDLHHHVFHWDSRDETDAAFWAAAVPLEVQSVPCLALCSADQLLHVLVHGMNWNPEPQIRWVADAAVTIVDAGPALDWDRLLAQARARDLLAPVRAGLLYLAERLAVPVPPGVRRSLVSTRIGGAARIELAVRQRGSDGVLGALPLLWFDYRRVRVAAGKPAGVGGFLRELRRALAPSGPGSLAAVLLRKAIRRLAGRRRERGRGGRPLP